MTPEHEIKYTIASTIGLLNTISMELEGVTNIEKISSCAVYHKEEFESLLSIINKRPIYSVLKNDINFYVESAFRFSNVNAIKNTDLLKTLLSVLYFNLKDLLEKPIPDIQSADALCLALIPGICRAIDKIKSETINQTT